MKQKHMFSLLDQTYTTVKVVYARNSEAATVAPDYGDVRGARIKPNMPKAWEQSEGAQLYTFKVPLSWNIQEGDIAVVKSNSGNGLSFVHVVSVDPMPDIDIDANFDYRWLVQKVDLTEFDKLVAKEKAFGDAMLEVERVKQRDGLLESWRNSLPLGSAARELFEQTAASLAAPVVEQEGTKVQ
jgi:hypothetical protein